MRMEIKADCGNAHLIFFDPSGLDQSLNPNWPSGTWLLAIQAVTSEGIGNVNLLTIAVDNGPDHIVYAEPVLSHYEFELPWSKRLSFAEWKSMLKAGNKSPSPEWTDSFLVPADRIVPSDYD